MNIGIIGAGFTGLSAAYYLSKAGHSVTVFEKDNEPGGLAIGYKKKSWKWTLEKHYHHWFTNDKSVLKLARDISYPVLIKRPQTSVFVNDSIYQLDSPSLVLSFPLLSPIDRFRMAFTLALLRFNPFWKPLEKFKASEVLPIFMGKKSYMMLWESQFKNKFGNYYKDVSLAWFWARITKRTPSLAYPKGGFLEFAKSLVKATTNQGGKFLFGSEIVSLSSKKGVSTIVAKVNNKKESFEFDYVIVTLPSFLFTKIAPTLPVRYKNSLKSLKGLGAINVVLSLSKPFFPDKTYWLSVCDTSSPIMAIVEHTNFMDKKNYNNEHLVYLGNYLPADHPYFSKDAEELLSIYDPYLKKINSNYKKNLIEANVFKVSYAQPVIPINYSKQIPSFKTPFPNVYLANMQQVYPWDRGTNYAVELGLKVSSIIDPTI